MIDLMTAPMLINLFCLAAAAATGVGFIVFGQFPQIALGAAVGTAMIALIWQIIKTAKALPAAVIFFLALTLDAPWGRAFNTVTPITEILGEYLFSPLHTSFGLSWISFSLFEILSIAISSWVAAQTVMLGNSGKRPIQILPVIFLLPCAILFAALVGIAKGNTFALILTQTRFLAILPMWTIIGYGLLREQKIFCSFLGLLTIAGLLKCSQALWIYRTDFNGSLGSWEFLVEHASSELMVFAGLWVLCLLWIHRAYIFYLAIPAMISLGILAYIFALNDRRASLVGTLLSLTVIPFACPRRFRTRMLVGSGVLAICALSFLLATWGSTGPIAFPAATIKGFLFQDPDSSTAYRQAENGNLVATIVDNPLWGLGFGMRFPKPIPLENISAVYENYDLIPHNTLLYLWTYGGPLTIAGFALYIIIILSQALRVCRNADDSSDFFIALLVAFAVIRWLVNTMADLGLTEVRFLMVLGLISGGLFRMVDKGKLQEQQAENI